MIRWRYLIPRLTMVGLLVALILYGSGPLCRWAIVTGGTAAIGAKVELDAAEVALWRADVKLINLRVTDPNSPLNNLFEIGEASLDVDGDALLERKLVVRDGHIAGLRFNTQRDTSGAVLPEPSTPGRFDLPLPKFDEQWLLGAAGKLREDWEKNLQTVQLGEELLRRWPEEYRKQEARVRDLKGRLDKLRAMARDVQQGNPLQAVELIPRATEEARALKKELEELPREVKRLAEQTQRDREGLLAAKDHDVQFVKSQLRLEAFNAQSLTSFLLSEEEARRVSDLLAWVQWARQYVPVKREAAGPERQRGRTIAFPGTPPTPRVLFEQLAISGEATWQGQPLPFEGRLTGLTTNPKCYGKPATMTVQTSGPQPLLVNVVVDRTGAEGHDHLAIACPKLAFPARTLGDKQTLAVSVAAVPADLNVAIDLRGEALAGQIHIVQPQVQLQTAVGDKCGGEPLATRLNQALGGVKALDISVTLGGTLKRPQWSLDSNLGPQLADGVKVAFRQELELRAQQVTKRLDSEINRQLAKLDDLIESQSEKLLGDNDALRGEVERLAQSLVARVNLADRLHLPSNLPDAMRGVKLPMNELLRR